MAESDTRDYILAVESNKAEARQIAGRTAQRLERRETTLIEVVQSLGEYINDEDAKIRGRAISYLTAIITALPPTYLTRQQIDVLCNFLCARIEEGNAVEGLAHLQGFDKFTLPMAQTVVRAMFNHFPDLQSHKQTERHAVLLLLNSLLQKHRKALKDMGDESLAGITALVHGEKDPRNLMLVFSMLRVLMVEWDISRHVEALFDSVYAYFPITFRPPPNDPYGITAQHLKDRLKDCLSSNGVLAPHTFPNLLDRLDSTSPAVKKDALQALTACAQSYPVYTISQYSITIWDAVKFEILQAQEPELAEEALHVIEAISASVSKSSNSSRTSSPLVQYLNPITRECLEHLQEPAARQAKAAGDILKAVASASTQAFEVVLKSIGPALLTIYESADGIIKQRATLEVANQLLEAALEVYGSWTSLSPKNANGKENLLAEFKDKLTAIYSQVLMGTVKEEVSFRLTAANGLLLLSQMRSLLQDDEIGLFVQYYDDIILTEESYGRDELKQKSMSALAEISKFKPRLISDITFPAFTARLPDSEEEAKSSDYQSVLEALSEISVERGLLETLMRRLLNKLDLLFRSNAPGPFSYSCAILGTIYHVLNRTVETQDVRLDAYFDGVVVALSKRAAQSSAGPLADSRVVDLLGRVSNLIVRRSAADKVVAVSDNVYTLFRDSLAGTDAATSSLDSLFSVPTPIILSMWLLAALPRQVNSALYTREHILKRISELITFAERSSSNAIEISSLRLIALYVNKHLSNSDLDKIDDILSKRRLALKSNAGHQNLTLRLIFFLTKALTLRLAPKTNEYLNNLADLLSSDYPVEVSQEAAKLFRLILLPDDVLSKANFAQIRLLTPQRVFQFLTPLISRRFQESTETTERETYLIALSGVLSTVPSEIVMPELPTLLPLLLQSLDLSDQTVKIATLETLGVVITNNPLALEESGHVPALTRRLLTSAALAKAPTAAKQASVQQNLPRARRLATRCLTLMPKYITGSESRVNPLLALKRDVLQGLTVVLDDPKRDVRKEAVDARAAWLRSVDDLDEDEDE